MSKFKKGLFLGGLLGAGLMWLNVTKKGKAMRDSIMDQAMDIYEELKEKIFSSDAWETLTENKYVAMVHEAVDKYAIKNDLAQKMRQMIAKLVVMQWRMLEAEIKKEKRRRQNEE